MQKLTKLVVFSVLAIGLMVSCTKRDPAPENKDPVFSQLQKDGADAKAALEYVQAYIKTNQEGLNAAVPQSGERAVFEKRVNEGLLAQTYAAQQVRMYEVRSAERKLYVQRRYLESLTADGRKWPEEGEADAELLKLQLMREKTARLKNTLNKDESADVPRGTNEEKSAEQKPGDGKAGNTTPAPKK